MRSLVRLVGLLALVACKGGGSDGDGDGVAGDDDDDVTHSTQPFSQVETSQAECCVTVKKLLPFIEGSLEPGKYEHAVPEDPIGLVVIFHGSSSSVAAVQQTEWLEFYNMLWPRGIGVLLVNSPDRDEKKWDSSPPDVNPDVDHVEEALARVSDETDWDINDPLVTVGFSNGARFSGIFAEAAQSRGRDVKGAVMHQGGDSLIGGDIPGLWVSGENDTGGGGAEAMEENARLQGNGSLHLAGTEVALHPNRFAKLGVYDEDLSQTLFDELVDMEWIDPDGWRIFDFEGDPDDHADSLENRLDVRSAVDVMVQLRVTWSIHRFSAQNKVPEAEWIEEQLLR